MIRTYEKWLKYYENATKEQAIEDMMLDIKEIERLNNIINELEGWLKSNEEHFAEAIPFRETLRKLQELKENK